MTYTNAFKRLSSLNILQPLHYPNARTTKPTWWEVNSYCLYHRDNGHNTEGCLTLKHKIQDLIDLGIVPKPPKHSKQEASPSLDHEICGVWFSDEEDDYEDSIIAKITPNKKGATIPYKYPIKKESVSSDVTHLTRSGRPYQTALTINEPTENQPKAPTIPTDKGKEVIEETILLQPHQLKPKPTTKITPLEEIIANNTNNKSLEDMLLKQLQKTKTDISIWQLIQDSDEHRQALLDALQKINIKADTSPEEIIGNVTKEWLPRPITFSDKDLPPYGSNHNLALYITVECKRKTLPIVLVDNGSAVNVLPLTTAYQIGLSDKDFTPCNEGVRAFDGTRRNVKGTISLHVKTGPIERKAEFQVIDINPSYNMLLGRPWIHTTQAITSTLHQKVKLPLNGKIITIEASNFRAMVQKKDPEKKTAEITTDPEEDDLCGFDFFTGMIENDPNFGKFSNDIVNNLMKNQGYVWGGPLNPKRSQENPKFNTDSNPWLVTLGLGYDPTEREIKELIKERDYRKKYRDINLRPYTHKLTDYFVKTETINPTDSLSQHLQGLQISEDCYNNDHEGVQTTQVSKEELIHMVMRDQNFNPNNLITGPEDKTVKGWRKSIKWTDSKGRVFKLTTGEGAMFKDEEEEIEDDAEEERTHKQFNNKIESKFSLESEGGSSVDPKVTPSLDIESLRTSFESIMDLKSLNTEQFNLMYSAFNKINNMNKFAYDSSHFFPRISSSKNEINGTLQRYIANINSIGEQNSIIEQTKTINIGTPQNPQELQIGTTLEESETTLIIQLLTEFKDVFAWSYKDMPGIDRSIAEHRIPIKPGYKPVKQKLRRMRPEWSVMIKDEIEKQLQAGFIQVSEYADWVSNMVPVLKKNGKIRVCVDFRDLNKASPKDDFPLPHVDVLVDNTADHALLSFMDGYAGYNQIKMAKEDMAKTTFITPWGTYCYTVMPFGLINAGATYQRTATTLLHDMMHKEVEVYVDDMIVKSKERGDHITNLRKFFTRIRKYNMRLNPQKCTFGVTSGKLLGYVVSQRGIEIDPSKIKAISEMKPPKNIDDIRSFLGQVQFISRFISKLTMICEPIFRKLKKDEHIKWDDACQQAFDKIKELLSNPPVLMPPQKDLPLSLYLTTTHTAMGAMLAQVVNGEERAIYYISKKFQDYETRYNQLEKSCIALVWATKKLRHYMLSHQVQVYSKMDPIKYLFEKPILNGRIARWTLLLSEYDLKYTPLKAIKGRAVSDFLAENAVIEEPIIDTTSFPDDNLFHTDIETWELYFDGASNHRGCGVGILLISPDREHTPLSIKLDFDVTNNAAEYEACLHGLQAALALHVKSLRVYGDSLLIINQVIGTWKTQNDNLALYQTKIEQLIQKFKQIEFIHLPREENQFADALAKLSSLVSIPNYMDTLPIIVERRSEPAYIHAIDNEEDQSEPWYQAILNFKTKGEYPPNTNTRGQRAIRLLASQFTIQMDQLLKKTPQGTLLICVDYKKGQEIIEQVHDGECGPHMNARTLCKQIMRLGWYWTTMEADCIKYVKHCHNCQIFANVKHVPPSPLYSLTSPWPFSTWGIDVIGKIFPLGTGGHCFILVAIDYFTKWVEAASYRTLGSKEVANFIQTNIICRYGVPHEIISDQGTHFRGQTETILTKYKIKHRRSSPYRPQTNGAVEAANKTIVTILEKMIENHRDWPDKIPFALWGYRTSIRTPTGMTPYFLTYGMEAVQPVEVEIPSLRMLIESNIPEADWCRERYEQLILLDERRLNSLSTVQMYQARLQRAFNKRIKPRNIKVGDLVLKSVRAPLPIDPRGKFKPNWAGPYLVKEIYSGGAVKLVDLDGQEFTNPTNLDQLKKYYP